MTVPEAFLASGKTSCAKRALVHESSLRKKSNKGVPCGLPTWRGSLLLLATECDKNLSYLLALNLW